MDGIDQVVYQNWPGTRAGFPAAALVKIFRAGAYCKLNTVPRKTCS